MFRILHLSDLHVKVETQWSTAPILEGAKALIKGQSNEENIDVVAFTGDIAHGGKAEEYEIAAKWLDELCESTSGLNLDSKAIMFVPGNHDVDRKAIPAAATAIEQALGKAEEQADVALYYQDPDSLKLLRKRHAAFYEFVKSFTGLDDMSSPGWSRIFEHSGKRIRFDGFDSSWLCSGNDEGRLIIGQPQLSDALMNKADCDMTIALAHHPLSALKEFDQRNTNKHFRQHHDLFLRGHKHDADVIEQIGGSGGYIEVSAGALHERHESENRFCIIDIAESLEAVLIRTFVWKDSQWILDRNLVDSNNGIRRIDVTRKAQRKSRSSEKEAKTNPTADDARERTKEPASFHIEDVANDEDDSEVVLRFPRWDREATNQDKSIRQELLVDAMSQASIARLLSIRQDAGSKHEGFLACIATEFTNRHPDSESLFMSCAGINSGQDLQDSLATTAHSTVTDFAAALRRAGPTLLILEDLDFHEEESTSGRTTVQEVLDALLFFCRDLVIVRVSGLPSGDEREIRIGDLDLPDTREYLENASNTAEFPSTVDFSRVHRVTGGLPVHLDAVLDALSVTNLEGALAQIDSESEQDEWALPDSVTQEVLLLQASKSGEYSRIRRLLWTLSILERGESLDAIKRVDANKPIWAKHANHLEQKGCLDILEAGPKHYGEKPSMHPSRDEKILRVPRMVRDYVVSLMEGNERIDLTRSAATLYFGSDWRLGVVRIRRRMAFANSISSHQSGNEMTILRALASDQQSYFGTSGGTAYGLGLSYISQLKSKGFYGEAYEASREFLGMASSADSGIAPEELQTLQRLAGSCARMIGERDACIEFLTSALPSLRESGVKSTLCDVLIDLGLAFRATGEDSEAEKCATEILDLTGKESSDYFQAKAILAESEVDIKSRIGRLRRLSSRARNLGHHTVADNIALLLASTTTNVDEKLKYISEVKSRGEREYNYVRATIRRIETLLDAGRGKEITSFDERDLWRSYGHAYSQRLSGIFDWCHRVCWRYLDFTGNQDKQNDLFMVSSFVWRLNGNRKLERTYLEILDARRNSESVISSAVRRLFEYCQKRLVAIAERES